MQSAGWVKKRSDVPIRTESTSLTGTLRFTRPTTLLYPSYDFALPVLRFIPWQSERQHQQPHYRRIEQCDHHRGRTDVLGTTGQLV